MQGHLAAFYLRITPHGRREAIDVGVWPVFIIALCRGVFLSRLQDMVWRKVTDVCVRIIDVFFVLQVYEDHHDAERAVESTALKQRAVAAQQPSVVTSAEVSMMMTKGPTMVGHFHCSNNTFGCCRGLPRRYCTRDVQFLLNHRNEYSCT